MAGWAGSPALPNTKVLEIRACGVYRERRDRCPVSSSFGLAALDNVRRISANNLLLIIEEQANGCEKQLSEVDRHTEW